MSYKTKGVIRSQTKRASYSDELKPATLIPIAIQQTKTASCLAPAAVEAIAEGLPTGEEDSRPLGMIEIILQGAQVQSKRCVRDVLLRGEFYVPWQELFDPIDWIISNHC